jgi:hypothetical protein
VRTSLMLADTPEDRHGTYPDRTLAERRRAWLHEHVGEPLPAELREDAAHGGREPCRAASGAGERGAAGCLTTGPTR